MKTADNTLDGFTSDNGGRLVRGEWKLVLDSPLAPLELYNLKRDPPETTDFAAKEDVVVRDLNAALRHQVQRGGAAPWQALTK